MQTLEQIKTKLVNLLGSKGPLRLFAFEPGQQEPLLAIGENELHDPASLTKLMNLYVVCSMGGDLPESLTISQTAWNHALVSKHTPNYGATKVGDSVPIADALRGMVTASDNVISNEFAVTLGAVILGIGPSPEARYHAYIARMNATAQQLGMSNTRFINPSGLPLESALGDTDNLAHTTAADMAKLITALYRDFPEQAKTYLEPDNKKILAAAHHGLNKPTAPSYLTAPGVIFGAKTGFTNRALFNIAGMAESLHGQKLAIVLLGIPDILRAKAIALVNNRELPKKPKRPDKDPRLVDGDAFRDAVTKNLVEAWANTHKFEPRLKEAATIQDLSLPPIAPLTFEEITASLPLMPSAIPALENVSATIGK